jgi:hypothetical protein
MRHQLLNHKAGVALETRAGRSRSQLDFAFLIDCQLRSRAAAPAPLLARRLRIGRLLHAARLAIRLDIRPRRTALEPRDLVALRRNPSAQTGHLLQRLDHQQLQLARCAAWITVDDTGARHKAHNGFCTQIGNAHFTAFATTSSKSRLNFLTLLRAGHDDYVVNDAALAYMRERALASPVIARLAEHPDRHFADQAAWTAHLERLGGPGADRHRRRAVGQR